MMKTEKNSITTESTTFTVFPAGSGMLQRSLTLLSGGLTCYLTIATYLGVRLMPMGDASVMMHSNCISTMLLVFFVSGIVAKPLKIFLG